MTAAFGFEFQQRLSRRSGFPKGPSSEKSNGH